MQLQEEEKRFEMIYREQYPAMYRYATALLKNYSTRDGYASGRAEEVVQEAFGVAWEKRDELFASTAPAGWLIRAVQYKARELIREDQKWMKRVLRCSEYSGSQDAGNFHLRSELSDLLSEEEYLLLKGLYLEGYTYKELSRQLGVKQSALAMRVKRLKERLRKEL
ncbi:MAG TPA: hypothetical protein IAC15_10540 [Candidatus Onthomonas avicola]|nr:hypothetical protein [Candidatus Onthomonas avicola]